MEVGRPGIQRHLHVCCGLCYICHACFAYRLYYCVLYAMCVVCAMHMASVSCMCHVLCFRVSMCALKQERAESLANKAKGSWNLSYLNPDHNCNLGTSKPAQALLHPKPAAICPLHQQVTIVIGLSPCGPSHGGYTLGRKPCW